MAFVIHGRDPRTGEKSDPFFSNATTEELARTEATTQGLLIDRVDRHEDRTPAATTSLSTLGAAGAPTLHDGGPYEFSAGQNRVIGGLASTMHLGGIAAMVLGIIQAADAVAVPRAYMPAPLVPAVLSLVFGGLLIYAGDAFRRIVRTRGHDIDHLMHALARLRFIFGLMLGVAVLAIAAAAIMVITQRL